MPKESLEMMKKRNKVGEYNLTYDSYQKSLEPLYFWLIDFLGRTLRFNLEKTGEDMGASVVSQFFGEMGSRKAQMQQQAKTILGDINNLVRSVMNILYDLRELDRRLDVYEDLDSDDSEEREAANLTLKRTWMDEVDIKKGKGSINQLSQLGQQGPQFVSLRDAFMNADNLKDIEEMDLTERVKNVAKDKFEEYKRWREESQKELSQRRELILQYLKSQVESLRLYTNWAKPYLKAAQRLEFKDKKATDPGFIQAFDQNYIEVNVRGEKTLTKKGLERWIRGEPRSLKPPRLMTDEEKEEWEKKNLGPKVYVILEVNFHYTGKPALVRTGQGGQQSGAYRQTGMTEISFNAYVFTPQEYDRLKHLEEEQALEFIEGLTEGSLEALREDAEKYLSELEGKSGKEEGEIKNKLLGGFSSKEGGESEGGEYALSPLFEKLKQGFVGGSSEALKGEATKYARNRLFLTYDVFKSAHGLQSYPYQPNFNKPQHEYVGK